MVLYSILTYQILGQRSKDRSFNPTVRVVTRTLIGGGGGAYLYIRVLPDEFLLKSVVITVDFKRSSPGRTRIYEYASPINALGTALPTVVGHILICPVWI